MKFNVKFALIIASGFLGSCLLILNLYGLLLKDIRPSHFYQDELIFPNDEPLSYQKSIKQLDRKEDEKSKEFSLRINQVVSKSLAHIRWEKYDPSYFNQLIPPWENYILYLMGLFSDIPEYERYHYADYKRSIKRGIGICGDASMVLSEALEKYNIKNKIISFPDHVVTTVQLENEDEYTLDPDFGIFLPLSAQEIHDNPALAISYYSLAGFGGSRIQDLKQIYSEDFKEWDGVKHFITKKYYFEYFSYVLKWLIPLLCIFITIFFFVRKRFK
jgi:hypothetical protein